MGALPSRADFTDPSEVIVHVPSGSRPDSYNRFRFIAFWLTDQPWVPDGVRGQVFMTDLDRFTADVERRGGSVRVLTEDADPELPLFQPSPIQRKAA